MSDSAFGIPASDSLAEMAPEPLDPKTFDITEFARGLRPTTRKVLIYPNTDFVDELDELLVRLDEAEVRGDDHTIADETVEAVEREIAAVKQRQRASAIPFRVRAISNSAQVRFVADLKEKGVTDTQEVWRHLLASAIVEPAGVDQEVLAAIEENLPAQYERLGATFNALRSLVPEVDAPFSPGSSRNRQARRRS